MHSAFQCRLVFCIAIHLPLLYWIIFCAKFQRATLSKVQCRVIMRFACAATAAVADAFVKWSERECWLIPSPIGLLACIQTAAVANTVVLLDLKHCCCGGRLIPATRVLLAPTSLIPSLASLTLSCNLFHLSFVSNSEKRFIKTLCKLKLQLW